jgi:hypothetical protein
MNFKVRYRDSAGKLNEISIEAIDRADCFSKCKERKIAPVHITISSNKGKYNSGNHSFINFFVIAIVIGLSIGLILLLTQSEKEEIKPKEERATKKIVKTTVAKSNPAPVKVVSPKPTKPTIDMKSLTPEERREIQMEKFKARPIDLSVPSNRVVATATEQIMAWIFNTEVGDLPPPLPKIPETEMAHLAEILLSKNEISEKDNDQVAQTKETIQLIKKELTEFIKKGGNPKEFFDYYRGELVQAYEMRKTVQQSVQKVLREEPEIALEYLNEVNRELQSKGIKQIKLHPKQLKHFGIEPPNQGDQK